MANTLQNLAAAVYNDTSAPYSLADTAVSHAFGDFLVPSVTQTGQASPSFAGNQTYTAVLTAGGSKRNELISSGRDNSSYALANWSGGAYDSSIVSHTNTSCIVSIHQNDIDNTRSLRLSLTWSDGFNPNRTHDFRIDCGII